MTELVVTVDFPAESPRHGPIPNGYRPGCWIGRFQNGQKLRHDASLLWGPGRAGLERGMSARGILVPLRPEFWRSVKPGLVIELCEGPVMVASAVVEEVRTSD